MSSLATTARSVLLQQPEVTRFHSLRRSTCLFAQAQLADSVYLIEEGLVKLTRTNQRNGRIILNICGPDHVVGEEALQGPSATYYAEAEVLTPATVYSIPRDTLNASMAAHPELAAQFMTAVIQQKRSLAEKVELLCLHDVEYRILHYLAELATLLTPANSGDSYQLPITQLELADLIGATRETTSTTLNQLERRGLLKLSRRLLTIPNPITLRSAAAARGDANGSNTEAASAVI